MQNKTNKTNKLFSLILAVVLTTQVAFADSSAIMAQPVATQGADLARQSYAQVKDYGIDGKQILNTVNGQYGANLANIQGKDINITTNGTVGNIYSNGGMYANWNNFDVAQGQTMNFTGGGNQIQNVIGSNMSEFAGNVNADGHLTIINPNGMIMEGTAVFNVAGSFLPTTQKGLSNEKSDQMIKINPSAIFNVGKTFAVLAGDINIDGADIFAGDDVVFQTTNGVAYSAGKNIIAVKNSTIKTSSQNMEASNGKLVVKTSGDALLDNVYSDKIIETNVDKNLHLKGVITTANNNLLTGGNVQLYKSTLGATTIDATDSNAGIQSSTINGKLTVKAKNNILLGGLDTDIHAYSYTSGKTTVNGDMTLTTGEDGGVDLVKVAQNGGKTAIKSSTIVINQSTLGDSELTILNPNNYDDDDWYDIGIYDSTLNNLMVTDTNNATVKNTTITKNARINTRQNATVANSNIGNILTLVNRDAAANTLHKGISNLSNNKAGNTTNVYGFKQANISDSKTNNLILRTSNASVKNTTTDNAMDIIAKDNAVIQNSTIDGKLIVKAKNNIILGGLDTELHEYSYTSGKTTVNGDMTLTSEAGGVDLIKVAQNTGKTTIKAETIGVKKSNLGDITMTISNPTGDNDTNWYNVAIYDAELGDTTINAANAVDINKGTFNNNLAINNAKLDTTKVINIEDSTIVNDLKLMDAKGRAPYNEGLVNIQGTAIGNNVIATGFNSFNMLNSSAKNMELYSINNTNIERAKLDNISSYVSGKIDIGYTTVNNNLKIDASDDVTIFSSSANTLNANSSKNVIVDGNKDNSRFNSIDIKAGKNAKIVSGVRANKIKAVAGDVLTMDYVLKKDANAEHSADLTGGAVLVSNSQLGKTTAIATKASNPSGDMQFDNVTVDGDFTANATEGKVVLRNSYDGQTWINGDKTASKVTGNLTINAKIADIDKTTVGKDATIKVKQDATVSKSDVKGSLQLFNLDKSGKVIYEGQANIGNDTKIGKTIAVYGFKNSKVNNLKSENIIVQTDELNMDKVGLSGTINADTMGNATITNSKIDEDVILHNFELNPDGSMKWPVYTADAKVTNTKLGVLEIQGYKKSNIDNLKANGLFLITGDLNVNKANVAENLIAYTTGDATVTNSKINGDMTLTNIDTNTGIVVYTGDKKVENTIVGGIPTINGYKQPQPTPTPTPTPTPPPTPNSNPDLSDYDDVNRLAVGNGVDVTTQAQTFTPRAFALDDDEYSRQLKNYFLKYAVDENRFGAVVIKKQFNAN